MKFHLLTLEDVETLEKKGYIDKNKKWTSSWSRITYFEKTEKGKSFTGNQDNIKCFWDEQEKNKTVTPWFLQNQAYIGIRSNRCNISIRYESTREYWSKVLIGNTNFKRMVII